MSAACHPRSTRRSASYWPLGSANESSVGRWMTVLFLLALAGTYHLGLQQCNNEVKEESGVENVEEKHPWHTKIIGSIGGPTPPKQGSFTLDRLKATRKECNTIVTMLENYYFGKEQATKMLMNHGMANGILKHLRVRQICVNEPISWLIPWLVLLLQMGKIHS